MVGLFPELGALEKCVSCARNVYAYALGRKVRKRPPPVGPFLFQEYFSDYAAVLTRALGRN